jgi:hypothetical protein
MNTRVIPLLALSLSLFASVEATAIDPKTWFPHPCTVGFKQDWTGIEGPDLAKGTYFHPDADDPVWHGKRQPTFAKAIFGGVVCKDRDERGLPTRTYFTVTDKKYCANREKYARQYYDFWEQEGAKKPTLTRIPDATSLPLCAENPHANGN